MYLNHPYGIKWHVTLSQHYSTLCVDESVLVILVRVKTWDGIHVIRSGFFYIWIDAH